MGADQFGFGRSKAFGSSIFPSLLTIDLQVFPGIKRFTDAFGSIDVALVPIPEDCLDGFLGAVRPAILIHWYVTVSLHSQRCPP